MAAGCGFLGAFGGGSANEPARRKRDDTWGVGYVVGAATLEAGEVDRSELVFRRDDRAAVDAVLLDSLFQFGEHNRALALFAGQQLLGVGDQRFELVGFVIELLHLECGQAAQRHIEHVGCLNFGEVELTHQRSFRRWSVFRRTDDLDDTVDVVERNEQTGNDVQARFPLGQPELGASDNDLKAVLNVVVAQVPQANGRGNAIDEHHVVDAERFLKWSHSVEVGENSLRASARAKVDLNAKRVGLVGQVLRALALVDAGEFADRCQLVDLGDDLLRANHVRELGDDERLAAAGELDRFGFRSNANGASAGFVRVAQSVVDEDSARREIGARYRLHQFVDRWLGATLLHDEFDGVSYFAQVVGWHVGGHTHRNAGGAVDEQVGNEGRQHRWLVAKPVEGRGEVDGFFVDFADHVHGGG